MEKEVGNPRLHMRDDTPYMAVGTTIMAEPEN
jgi:hypothetical protein